MAKKQKFINRVKIIISEYGFKLQNIISMDDLMLIDGQWSGYFVACRGGETYYFFASETNQKINVTYGGYLKPKPYLDFNVNRGEVEQ